MGFKPWRNGSVLLLASVALFGCNNPQKDRTVIGTGPKVGDPTLVKGQQPGAQYPGGQAAFPTGFPKADPNANQGLLLNNQPKAANPNNTGVVPLGASGNPGNGIQMPDRFAPLPDTGKSSSQPPRSYYDPQALPMGNGGFGADRPANPTGTFPGNGVIAPPSNFIK